ncbi:MAG TPA: tetratricopeptide repeat protein [Kofleriaceae bacterium]|nr:tetratricopeptide repeat protein [Kofleriaceae bacterium]
MMAAGADIRVVASVSELDPGPLSAELMFFHIARGSNGNGHSLDGAATADIAAAAERLPPGGQVVAVVPRGDLALSVAAMRAHPRVVGVLALDHLRLSDLTAMTTRLLLGNVFGLDKVLPWGARVHQLQVGDYPEKAEAVRQISSFAAAVGLRRMHRERIERCCDEMMMNAIYDAPIGPDGAPMSRPRAHTHPGLPRSSAVGSGAYALSGRDRAVVEFGYDGRRFAVAVRDRFGRFERETLIRYLDKCLNSQQQVDHRVGGGAGLGLYFMSRSASSLMFNLKPGAATECICIFDIEAARPELDQIGVFEERGSERIAELMPGRPDSTRPRAEPTPADPSVWRMSSPATRRRQIMLFGAIAGVVALAAVAGGLWVARDRGAVLAGSGSCDETGDQITAVWPGRRADVEKAFRAVSAGRSDPALVAVNLALDDYASDWTAMAGQSCDATRAGKQSQQLHERRSACLAQRQHEMADLVELLAAADAKVVENAADSVHALGPVAQCEDALVLDRGIPLPEDPARRAAIEKIRALVSRATANVFVGRGEPARAQLDEAAGELPTADYLPVESELRLARGRLETLTGNFPAAKSDLLRASELAETSGYDLARARALVELVYVVGYELQDFDQGELFVRMARGPLQRAGGDRGLEASLLRNAGMVSFAGRDFQRASERQMASLAIREKIYGVASGEVAEVLRDLASTLRELGQLDEARTRAQRALDIVGRIYGVKHRQYGLALTELGNVLTARGEYEQARRVYQQTLDLGYEVLTPGHPLLAIGMVNLGNVELLAGEPAKAIAHYEKALAVETAALGEDHLQVAASLMNLGAARESAGQLVEAERTYGRALAIRRLHLGEHHALVGEALGSVGLVELTRGRAPRAVEDLERAVALSEESRADGERLGELRFGLARALWKTGGDKVRAHQLAERAAGELTDAGADDAAAEAKAWATQH